VRPTFSVELCSGKILTGLSFWGAPLFHFIPLDKWPESVQEGARCLFGQMSPLSLHLAPKL